MTRYRPPSAASTLLITPEGAQRLRAELHDLWHVKRPQITNSVREAAAQGDRSENAEYTYGKKMLREIDRRVRFLKNRLEHIQIVTGSPTDPSKIYFGAWITLESTEGQRVNYRIVGPDELDLKQRLISIDAPLARALLGKSLGNDVVVTTPTGHQEWLITAIKYTDNKPSS